MKITVLSVSVLDLSERDRILSEDKAIANGVLNADIEITVAIAT